ncbi:hypothetical protein [Flavobacterium sp. N502540]|uniref:hypothetical protein n=1 Tax=Flavobacterium sp. N502540 TaxID=2986838 RepID=UPI0022244D18|nr:hypothetical protein [Flavobacterium sp. N502540]
MMKAKFLKFALCATVLLGVSAANAQSKADINRFTSAVKVVDNKGTIKYFQSSNGITQIVNKTNELTTTTWQLGGQLTDDTYIDATGKVFGLDGLVLETGAPSTDATTASIHGGTGTGWTLLVRDEATGATKKMKAESLVSGIRVEYTQVANAAANVDVAVVGLPVLTAGTTDAKLFVFRNGIKLRSGTDFVAAADKVTITYSESFIPMYASDVIEVQYVK